MWADFYADDLKEFATGVESILGEEGLVFVSVKIVPDVENLPIDLRQRRPSRSRAETLRDLREDLGIAAD